MLSYSPQWTDCDESCWLVWCFPQWTHIMHQQDLGIFANIFFENISFANILFANILFANISFANILFANILFANILFAKKCLKRIGSREEGHLRRLLTQRRYLLSLDHYIMQYKTTKEISVLKKFQKLEDVEQTCFVFNELKLLLTLSFRWHNTFRNIGY